MTRLDIAERTLWDAGNYLHRELNYAEGERAEGLRVAISILGWSFQRVSQERWMRKQATAQ